MAWNLYKKEAFLKPLCFSNGKSQEEVVNEVIDKINSGKKIIFIHGICGTGKSAIALNLALKLGKSSIVVPGKNLQNQYKRDYENDKYLKKENGEKLKISIITGRKNHICKFLEDNELAIPKIKREENSTLYDIFSGKKEKAQQELKEDSSANNKNLPCKIEIKEANWQKLKEYVKQNKEINSRNFSKVSDIKRLSVAPVCPYWGPVYPEHFDLKILKDSKKRFYLGLEETKYIQYKRKEGCSYYAQFDSYIDSDVIVFNSLKYKLETALNRKPKTEIEIIDECDEFLDSLSNQRTINLERLQMALIQALGSGEGEEEKIEELLELIKHVKKDKSILEFSKNNEVLELKKTAIYDILKIFLKEDWLKDIDDESYLFDVFETSKMFKEFLNETYVILDRSENSHIISLVTTNLEKKLNEFIKKNNCLVLMSGTLHSKEVISSIFGIKDFDVVEAETKDQGEIKIKQTGLEMDCKYSNFTSKKHTRKEYLKALNESIKIATRPTLVHVNAFHDIPSKEEIDLFNLDMLISREDLKKMQEADKTGQKLKEFKEGKINILFSTKDSRGVDFPGAECNSIVFTKYPNPNVDSPFWKILMKTKPLHYWAFYKDKARREFLQKIYRGLRFKEDKIELLSPDKRVLETAREEKGFRFLN